MKLELLLSQFIFREIKEEDLKDWNLIYLIIDKIELDGFYISTRRREDKLFRCKIVDQNGVMVSIYNHTSRQMAILFACGLLLSEYYKLSENLQFAN